MNDERKFKITGSIKDKYVAPSGKLGKLRVETSIGGRRSIDEVKFFGTDLIRQIETCGAGEFVTVYGTLNREAVKDKALKQVEVDGRAVYTTVLVGSDIESVNPRSNMQQRQTQAKAAPVRSQVADEIPDDDIPF